MNLSVRSIRQQAVITYVLVTSIARSAHMALLVPVEVCLIVRQCMLLQLWTSQRYRDYLDENNDLHRVFD